MVGFQPGDPNSGTPYKRSNGTSSWEPNMRHAMGDAQGFGWTDVRVGDPSWPDFPAYLVVALIR